MNPDRKNVVRIDKGWVRVQNLSQCKNKFGYIYVLACKGTLEKVALTSRFLQRKKTEYEALRSEIDSLTAELSAPDPRHLGHPANP